jgi:hypothetical protein
MKRATLVLLVIPLIALWLYGCDKASNPLEADTAEAATVQEAQFAKQGGKAPTSGIVAPEWVQTVVQGPNSDLSAEAHCPAGKVPLTGGYAVAAPAPNTDLSITYNGPLMFAEGTPEARGIWRAAARYEGVITSSWSVTALALCVAFSE